LGFEDQQEARSHVHVAQEIMSPAREVLAHGVVPLERAGTRIRKFSMRRREPLGTSGDLLIHTAKRFPQLADLNQTCEKGYRQCSNEGDRTETEEPTQVNETK
jgi:hypothetical protein